ncbi:hypothetical protein O3M35_010403 [Rhynocoris fuscipes]|uniref:Molybdate-anion transporter n=1 Tax=Rhynocoris fuscipes TaxID=488301 RepID=A0AAW1CYS4_9HEMI
MLIVIISCMIIAIVGAAVAIDKKSHSLTEPHNVHYKNLQRCYLLALYLATFADWLQGPYVYKLYKDYGYEDDSIAFLYIAGFGSSCIFGTIVGQLADNYGRKTLCTIFAILYSLCCITKTSNKFIFLLIGRILGGISTSILFTTFEAWYVNEHLNFYKLPAEWLNTTFTKATFYNGLSATLAGLVAQVLAEYFGPVSPFLLAIPFLIASLLVIQSTWKEHISLNKPPQQSLYKVIFSPLKYLKENDYLLLYLATVQSIFESTLYTFIFSWTPILAVLSPPLGLVFSIFMICVMCGSKTYACFVSRKRYQPHTMLVLSCITATISFIIVTLSLTSIVNHIHEHTTTKPMSVVCLIAFLIYEFSVGIYYPAVGYLRSRTVPEEFRATLSNWFRVPMNIVTCISLTLNYGSDSKDVSGLKKFQFVFALCSILMLGSVIGAIIFSKKYSKKVVHDELQETRLGKSQNTETV